MPLASRSVLVRLLVVGAFALSAAAAAPAGLAHASMPKWTGQKPGTNPYGLDQISCSSAKDCIAVGGDRVVGGKAGALHWNGSSWTATPLANASFEANGVSCVSATFCVAVGSVPPAGNPKPAAEVWNGKKWAAQSLGSIKGGYLDDVSCPTTSFCDAVGYLDDGTGDWISDMIGFNGKSWSRQDIGSTGDEQGDWYSVSCPSAKMCMAAGVDVGLWGVPNTAIWNGKKWALTDIEVHNTADAGGLFSISCPSTSFCEAVGLADNTKDPEVSSGPYSNITESWNGSKWSEQKEPAGVQYGGAVSCVSSKFCEEVGAASSGKTAAAVWTGSKWTKQSIPSPSDARDSAYYWGVSCVSTSACEAVGHYVTKPGNPTELAAAFT